MFPGLPSVDVRDIGELPEALGTALDGEGPSVISVDCSADEIPPFAPFVATPKKQLVFAEPVNGTAVSMNNSITKENRRDVVARS
jgi:autonomous glycyl radical cofactor GrcA